MVIPHWRPFFDIQTPAKEGESFDFKVQFELYPDLSSIEYSNLSLSSPPLKKEEEVEKEMDAILKNICQQMTSYEAIKDPSVKITEDHVVVFDLSAKDEKGLPLENYHMKDFSLDMKTPLFNADFNAHLLGMQLDESKEFKITLHHQKKGGDKISLSVCFLVNILAIKTKCIPEFNETFVKETLKEESLESFREKVRQEIQRKDKEQNLKHIKEQALSILLEKNPFTLPPRFLNTEQNKFLKLAQKNLKQKGMDEKEIEAYLKEHKISLEDKVDKDIKAQLLVHKLAEQEDIHFTDPGIKKNFSRSNEISAT